MRVAPTITLTDDERMQLKKLARSKRTSVRLAQRAQIVLLAEQGKQTIAIAAELGIGRLQVARWRERYAKDRLAGIERDLPRGAPPVKVDVAKLVELTTQSTPQAATQWSTRTMARELGVSAASVSRHWRANGLKPHLVRGFKVSRDPKFVEKLEDIVGLYMSPRSTRWCCAATRRAKSKHWIVPNRDCLSKGASTNDDARLQAQWHHNIVCCHEYARWHHHQHLPATAYACGVAQVPQED